MADVKRLYRSRKDKIIAGVCGGMGEYFNIDPVWIRIIFILLTILQGVGLLVYIIAWILMPINPVQNATSDTLAERTVNRIAKKIQSKHKEAKIKEQHAELHPKHDHSGALLFGTIFIVVGVAFMLKYFFGSFNLMLVWPIIVILIGLYLMFRRLE